MGLTLLYGLLIGAFFRLSAQDLTFQRIGMEALEGKDIYSIAQDKKGHLWMGTNDGVYCYDGQQFYTYSPHPDQVKARSVFGLCFDRQGQLYGFNLHGQILYVKGDSLLVYYQLPDSVMSTVMDIDVDDQDRLFVHGQHFFLIDQKRNGWSPPIPKYSSYGGQVVRDTVGRLWFHNIGSAAIGYWKDNQWIVIGNDQEWSCSRNFRVTHQNGVMEFFSKDHNTLLRYEGGTMKSYHLMDTLGDNCHPMFQCDLDAKGQFWFSCPKGGAYVYDSQGELVYPYKVLPNNLLSNYYMDRAGNWWIGTFKKGLLLLPHVDVQDWTRYLPAGDHHWTAVEAGPGDTLYLLSQEGNVYQLSTGHPIPQLVVKTTFLGNQLFYHPQRALYVDGGVWDIDAGVFTELKHAGVKRFQRGNAYQLLVTGSEYIKRVTQTIMPDRPVTYQIDPSYTYLSSNIGRRLMDMAYDTSTQICSVINTNGLFQLIGGTEYALSLPETALTPRSLVYDQSGTLYVSTGKAVWSYQKERWTKLQPKRQQWLSDLWRMEYQAPYVYLRGKGGVQRYHTKTGVLQTIDQSDGLLSEHVIDMAFNADGCWILTIQGLQIVPEAAWGRAAPVPHLYWKAWTTSAGVKAFGAPVTLALGEQDLVFKWGSDYYRHPSTLKYEYRLVGLDTTWRQLPQGQVEMEYKSLVPGIYQFEIQAITSKEMVSNCLRQMFLVPTPFWKRGWVITSSILLVLLGLVGIAIGRLRAWQREQALLLEKEAIEKRLIVSEQTALRSQMNPHFIFNALNSIQEMILLDEQLQASTYLGKFAALMRLYLNHSQKEQISLNDEVTALELYLELEQVRFGERLTINLQIDPHLMEQTYVLPPMLVQPYVENAFKHGLFHRKKDCQLDILMTYDASRTTLQIVIQDNGIGRSASQRIQRERGRRYEAFSTSATDQRLALLNYGQAHPISVLITDVVDATNRPLGTRVVLSIPQEL